MLRPLAVIIASFTLPSASNAADPEWWSAPPPVIDPAAVPNHHGPANIGQAKWMARRALDALRLALPETAGLIEADLVGQDKIIPDWDPPANEAEGAANRAPLLIGQLKAIAHPFYEHLDDAASPWLAAQRLDNGTETGGIFPWTDAPADDNNRGVANTGQLKAVFALRFEELLDPSGDADGDGLSNAQETALGTNPFAPDTSGDGIPDGWAYFFGLDPLADNSGGSFQGTSTTNGEAYSMGVQAVPGASLADHDGDSAPNELDADPDDADIDWERAPETGYVLIDIDVPSGAGSPRDLNDAGQVLFAGGIWSGGTWSAEVPATVSGSVTNSSGVSFSYETTIGDLLSFNSSGQKIASATVAFPPSQGQTYGFQSAGLLVPGQSARHLGNAVFDNFDSLTWMTAMGIDDTGRSFAYHRSVESGPNPGDPNITVNRIAVFNDDGGLVSHLTVPDGFDAQGGGSNFAVSSSGWVASNTTEDYNLYGAPSKLAVWNSSLGSMAMPTQAEGWFFPVEMNELPNDRAALAAYEDGAESRVFLSTSGAMKFIPSLSGKDLQMFAGDGTAMTSDGQLWRNGAFIPLRDLSDGIADLEDSGKTITPLKANGNGTFLIQAHNGDPQAGEAKLAARFGVRGVTEEEVGPGEEPEINDASGVDIVSYKPKLEEGDAAKGWQEKQWIMAPIGGPANEVRTWSGATAAVPIAQSSTTAIVDPVSLVDPKQDVTWLGEGQGGAESVVHVSVADSPPVETKVGLLTMKHRTVQVKVWRVPILTKSGISLLPIEIDVEEWEDYLNKVFERQINVEIELLTPTVLTAIDWDLPDANLMGFPEGTEWDGNEGALDRSGLDFGGELNLIRQTRDDHPDAAHGALIDLFLVGGSFSGKSWQPDGTPVDGTWDGTADRNRREVWVIASSHNKRDEYLSTAAHELGHLFVGSGHPDEGGGQAPLDGQRDPRRLMASGDVRPNGKALLKAEWDEAERWLSEREDGGDL